MSKRARERDYELEREYVSERERVREGAPSRNGGMSKRELIDHQNNCTRIQFTTTKVRIFTYTYVNYY